MTKSFALCAAAAVAVTPAIAGACVNQADAAAEPALGTSAITQSWASTPAGLTSLRTVSPTGFSTYLGAVDDRTQVADISLDGSRVLTMSKTPADVQPEKTTIKLWNVQTKRATTLVLPGNWRTSFTADGGSLTVRAQDGLTYKRDASGRATARYYGVPNSVAGEPVFVNPAGTRFVYSDGTKMVVRSTATGAVQRTVALPTGRSNCKAVIELDASSFGTDCGDSTYHFRLYQFGYTSAVATKALSPTRQSDDPKGFPSGYFDMLATTPRVGFGAADGSPSFPARVLTASGGDAAFPGNSSLNAYPSGGFGNQAYLLEWSPTAELMGAMLLRKYNLTNGTYSTLAGGTKGGWVGSAMTIDGHR